MKIVKLTALMFLILSYLCLILVLIFDSELQKAEFRYIFIVWGIGIINVVLNIYYGIKIETKSWILILFIICGLTWVLIPLLMTNVGIPFLILYLAIGIYIHLLKRAGLSTNK